MRIAVIGCGAAGLTAAGSAIGADVVVYEHNEKPGKKIYITGKGRCNFTNACDPDEFLQNVVNGARFLRGAIARFTPYDAIELLERYGCKTKVERGRRAFPLSDKASDVTKALVSFAEDNGAEIRLGAHVTDIKCEDGCFYVTSCGKSERYDKVILCTGGNSYSVTGSDGSGYALARKLGHDIVKPLPSLVALTVSDDLSPAQGLTLKNVSVKADGIKPIFGDLLVTERGISGPIGLTLSAYAARRGFPYKATLDLKPALDNETLDGRLLRDFGGALNKQFKNALDDLLPKSIIPIVVERSGIDPLKKVNSVTKIERAALIKAVKSFELTVIGNEGLERAVVTSGGVDVSQIDPRTMESKKVKGLYFGGEIIDVDALTGGFNFHIALATGRAAGINSAVTND